MADATPAMSDAKLIAKPAPVLVCVMPAAASAAVAAYPRQSPPHS